MYGRHRSHSGRDCRQAICWRWRSVAAEALALEEYKSGRLSKSELRSLLGFGTRYQLDGFLKAHEVYEDYSIEDFEREQATLRKLGF